LVNWGRRERRKLNIRALCRGNHNTLNAKLDLGVIDHIKKDFPYALKEKIGWKEAAKR